MSQTGADVLVRTLAENGVDTCFANPGTTEMHLVAALGREGEKMRTVLCLFEGVATGAADGYARMTGRPAAVLLHLGPGFANGMANLHNARKAGSAVLNIVGEHATYHLALDAPLAADIEGMAGPVSRSVATIESAAEVASATARLLGEIRDGGVGTLIVPNDVAWAETNQTPAIAPPAATHGYSENHLGEAAATLHGPRTALIVGAAHITRRMAELAHAIGVRTGATVIAETSVARLSRGGGTPHLPRIPFHIDQAAALLKDIDSAVLVGARDPVAFFAYPGRPSRVLPEGTKLVSLCPPGGAAEAALEALASALGAEDVAGTAELPALPEPEAPITAEVLGRVVAHAIPEGAVVVDESITNAGFTYTMSAAAAGHEWMNNRGGSIGFSLPVAVGAAVASPERQVITLTGDGSACYTLQALWTMAREKQNVTVLVLANRRYSILINETVNIGAGPVTDTTRPMLSLDTPALDWVKLAEGHGVPARAVATAEALTEALQAAFAEPGPHLIEVAM